MSHTSVKPSTISSLCEKCLKISFKACNDKEDCFVMAKFNNTLNSCLPWELSRSIEEYSLYNGSIVIINVDNTCIHVHVHMYLYRKGVEVYMYHLYLLKGVITCTCTYGAKDIQIQSVLSKVSLSCSKYNLLSIK